MSEEINEVQAVTSSDSGFDWSGVAAPDRAVPVKAAPSGGVAAYSNLPPTPPNTGLIAGRLPIRCDTGRAIVQLPEPIADVHCAVVMVNSGVLSDCYRPAKNVCVPTALRGRPINDREIEVVLDGGDNVAVGLGWSLSSPYPGAQLETRTVDVGVPYVEVLVLVGVGCGCDETNWKSSDDYQP